MSEDLRAYVRGGAGADRRCPGKALHGVARPYEGLPELEYPFRDHTE